MRGSQLRKEYSKAARFQARPGMNSILPEDRAARTSDTAAPAFESKDRGHYRIYQLLCGGQRMF
jgi:hypothetical protein